jgi:hypothetical protein
MSSQNRTRVHPSGRTFSQSRNTPTNITTTMPSMIIWCQPDESEVFSLQTGVSDELDLRVLSRSWFEDETDHSVSSSTTTTTTRRVVITHLSPDRPNNSSNINDVLQERRQPKAAVRNPLQDITCRTLNCRTLSRSVNSNHSNRR